MLPFLQKWLRLVTGLLVLQEEDSRWIGQKWKFSTSRRTVWTSGHSRWQQRTSTWHTLGHWYLTMEEANLRYCDTLKLPGIFSPFLRRTSGIPRYAWTPRCAYTRLTYYQSCYMDVKHGPSPRLAKHLNALNTWCLWKSLCIPYTRHTTNDTVQSITACSPVLRWFKSLRLRFFGHIARTNPESRGEPSSCHCCRT